MSNIVVMGAQWGDEGKGKIVDLLTENADLIVRFQGGNNAGHTLVVGDRKVILHLIPSGVLHEDKTCCIGNGVVLDPQVLCDEVDGLRGHGVRIGPERLKVSPKTHLILPYHKRLDSAREAAKTGKEKIGTTGRGIGPAYEDKASRVGIRACDVLDFALLREKIELALKEKNALFTHCYGTEPLDPDAVFEEIRPWAERLRDYLADISAEIEAARVTGKNVLFEGAQGTHLDIDHGTYPFVTSSNTVASNAAAGSGVGFATIDRVLAIVKAYTTRVGSGPFPTEMDNEAGTHLLEKGAEYGSTTGRKRRCGWLDIPLLRESVRLNSPAEIALTKLDVLSGLEEIKICVGYRFEGQEWPHPPQRENALAHVEPIYQTLPGWNLDVSQVTSWGDLPHAAQQYITAIEDLLSVRVGMVSVGPDRNQTLFL